MKIHFMCCFWWLKVYSSMSCQAVFQQGWKPTPEQMFTTKVKEHAVFTSAGLGQTCLELENAAVGNDFNQITFFLSFSSLPLLIRTFKIQQDSKQLLPSVTEYMSLPALGCVWPLHFLPYSFQRRTLQHRSIWASRRPCLSLGAL